MVANLFNSEASEKGWSFRNFLRRNATRTPQPLDSIRLATYHSPSWIQRHRGICILALLVFAFAYSAIFTLVGRFIFLQLMIPVVIFSLLVVWMLPENERPPLRMLQALFFCYLYALLCWPDYLAISLPGLPWITLLRLAGIPLCVVFLMCLSLSKSFRQEMQDILSASPYIYKSLIGFVILSFLSIALSSDPGFSLNRFFLAMLNWVLIFFVSVWVFSLPGKLDWLARSLWVISVFVCLIAIQEWRHSVVPWAGRIPSFLAVDDESVQRILAGSARAATGIYRVQSKFTTPLDFAEFLVISLPFTMHILAQTRRMLVRLAAVATICLVVWTLVQTDARLGMVGLFMALLFYALAWGILRWRSDKTSLFGPALTLAYPALFAAFIVATFFVGRLRALVWGSGAQTASTNTRKLMYADGFEMILTNPVGHGLGMGAKTLGFYNGNGILTIDTYYISIALELGVLGFILYYGMFICAIVTGTRAVWNNPKPENLGLIPVVISLAIFVIGKSVLSQQQNHPLVFMILGAFVASLWRAKQAGASRQAVEPIAPTGVLSEKGSTCPGGAVPA